MVDQAEIYRMLHQSDRWEEQIEAADLLKNNFLILPDIEKAWNEMYRLILTSNRYVLWHAAAALGDMFPHVNNKEQAWADLHRLTQDKDIWVRKAAAEALGKAFPFVPDKKQAWEDLHRLMQDKDSQVRKAAAEALHWPGNYYAELIRFVRLTGLIAAIAYMIGILIVWAYANSQGYIYFSAGEPNLMLKIMEWALGFIGIFVTLDYLRKELTNVTY